MNTIFAKVIHDNNVESKFESAKQITQHIETHADIDPVGRKKVAIQKISIRTLYAFRKHSISI